MGSSRLNVVAMMMVPELSRSEEQGVVLGAFARIRSAVFCRL